MTSAESSTHLPLKPMHLGDDWVARPERGIWPTGNCSRVEGGGGGTVVVPREKSR